MTNKHAVDHVVTNLNLFSQENDAHSELVGEILIMLVTCWYSHANIYPKQLPLITKGDPKRCFEEKVYVNLTSISVQIASKT